MATIDNAKLLRTEILQRSLKATGIGTVIGDTFIFPVASLFDNIDTITEFLTRLRSLDTLKKIETDTAFFTRLVAALRTTSEEVSLGLQLYIDKLGAQFEYTRKSANQATGFVQVARSDAPTVDITIPLGTFFFSTQTGQRYQATQTSTMTVANSSSFLNSDTALYTLDVPIKAVSFGVSGNIAKALIDRSETAFSNIDVISNQDAVTNGTNAESNFDFIERLKLAFPAHNLGTFAGYKQLVLQGTIITDVYVSGQGDLFMVRDFGDGGSVDIYLLDTQLLTISEQVNVAEVEHVFAVQPAKELVSVTGAGAFTVDITPDSTDTTKLRLITDKTSFYSGSIKSKTKLVFPTGTLPINITTPYTATYKVDSNVIIVQNFLNQPENKFLGGDALAKEAIQIDVDIFVVIKLLSGFTPVQVISDVTTAITNFINSFKLGVDLEQSDLIKVITEVDGVDQVFLPLNRFNRSLDINNFDPEDTIVTTGREFIRLKTLTIAVGA